MNIYVKENLYRHTDKSNAKTLLNFWINRRKSCKNIEFLVLTDLHLFYFSKVKPGEDVFWSRCRLRMNWALFHLNYMIEYSKVRCGRNARYGKWYRALYHLPWCSMYLCSKHAFEFYLSLALKIVFTLFNIINFKC